MRILLVEDNPQDADLTRHELIRSLAEVSLVTAPGIAEAWQVLRDSERFDVLLTDLQLADGSGLELVAGVRIYDWPIAVVVLTGTGDERTAIAALKAGADDYLVKRGDYLRELPGVLESAVAYATGKALRHRTIRVLYAEHNAMDVDLTHRHLKRHAPHIQIDSVSTGENALHLLEQKDN